MLSEQGIVPATSLSQDDKLPKRVSILGCRGIPGKHGGFETFAERLALFLVDNGWDVSVYCQSPDRPRITEEIWKRIRLIHVPSSSFSALSTIIFDWKSILHAARDSQLVLTLGYNTSLFGALYRLKDIKNITNMDGMEWRRQKWKFHEKAWLYLNELGGCFLSDYLIADHPAIGEHLRTRVRPEKISVIPYCADRVYKADARLLAPYNLEPDKYALIIARPEPENKILEVVSAFSAQKRGLKLVVLGKFLPHRHPYHRQVVEAASDEVVFTGGIYQKNVVQALRMHTRLYCHGHSVGGTNPSLVEALAAGSPVLAHDNSFNRWVAGKSAHYFQDRDDCREQLDQLLANPVELERMHQGSLERFYEHFSDNRDLKAYTALLMDVTRQNTPIPPVPRPAPLAAGKERR